MAVMLRHLFQDANPLFALSILLIGGFLFGWLASKLRLPSLVGQIMAGILIGPYGLKLFTPEVFHNFAPVTDLALCVFGLTMGTHLILRQLHNAGDRILLILLCEVLLVPASITAVLYFVLHLPLPECLLLGAIGLTTSPSTIIHLIVSRRARGIFTKTLVTSVALNSIASLVLFSIAFQIALALVGHQAPLSPADLAWIPSKQDGLPRDGGRRHGSGPLVADPHADLPDLPLFPAHRHFAADRRPVQFATVARFSHQYGTGIRRRQLLQQETHPAEVHRQY